jgi:carboxymethylenebutenolidase
MEILKLELHTRTIDGYYYPARGLDEGKKAAGILFLHDLTGLQKVNHKTADILSQEGFNVLMPDLFSETGQRNYCVRFFFDEFVRNNHAEGNEPLHEIFEIIDHFKSFADVDEENLGMVGQCLSGGFVLHAAIRPEMKAPVVFHHSFGRKGSGIPSGCSALIRNTVQGHYVHLDAICPPSRVKELEKELGPKLEKYYYWLPHGIPHLFFRNKQGRQAFDRMMAFFKTRLKN